MARSLVNAVRSSFYLLHKFYVCISHVFHSSQGVMPAGTPTQYIHGLTITSHSDALGMVRDRYSEFTSSLNVHHPDDSSTQTLENNENGM